MVLHHKLLIKTIAGTTIFLVVLLILNTSCNPTRYVKQQEYLLNKVKVDCDCKQNNINKEELESYIKQKPNTRIINSFRFHLGVYNLFNRGKERKWKSKIKEVVGEEPVIYDPYLEEKTCNQFRLFLNNKGFFNSLIKDSVRLKNKKASIIYFVKANKAYTINNIQFAIPDTFLGNVLKDTANKTLIRRNRRYDVDELQKERLRITSILKNNGYYDFSKEFIEYEVDSALNSYQVNIVLKINNYQIKTADNKTITTFHKKFKINHVYIFPDFDPAKALQNQAEYFSGFDTLMCDSYYFLGKGPYTLKPKTITKSLFVNTGDLYRISNIEESYKHLSELQQFKLINIQFSSGLQGTEISGADTFRLLDCNIQLTPFTRQSYEYEVEGKNSSGNFGVGGNVKYHHKNLFKGAENFDFKVAGSLEIQTNVVGNEGQNFLPNTVEYSTEARLNLPEFLLLVKLDKFYKQFNPRTSLALSYSFQNRPDYSRVISNISYGYYWKTSKYLRHWVNPVELNAVKLKNISAEFWNSIQDPYLRNSFENQLISVSSYGFEFNNQDINKVKDFKYLRFNIEFSGNILSSVNKMTGKPESAEGYYELFGTRYAQYFKTDLDFRYYQVFDKSRMLVYRCFAGAGIPYGNSEALPFIKKYFSGGANSIRAWQVRSVGPGSYSDISSIPNLLGDIKLEGNLEYRFDMFWILKGAFFIDAGNVWALNEKTDNREGAEFDFRKFYRQIAIGTGFGTRFDFTYFLFRIDFGIKLHDPKKPSGEHWVIGTHKFQLSDIVINIGVAYPF